MSSIISGYAYDIFISYRQKDNKHDGWVADFIHNLKGELERTFKEDISVYFDINPHDGLLETYDVDATLKEKLKCLIFIPIISRTYCDPKSFAWEHEFKSFVELASHDQFGLKIKLPGGNVVSRILPVQIHELDADDNKLIETVLGGYLRGIEFIYREPGVNRPLISDENHPDNNLNKTDYRNQVNKVANAIKEIITGLKNHTNGTQEIQNVHEPRMPEVGKKLKPKVLAGYLLVSLIVIAGYFFISKPNKTSRLNDKSIAVLPFENLSNDSTQIYFCNGFIEELLNDLQKIKEFTVRSRTSTFQYRKTNKTVKAIGDEMNVKYLVEGSIEREGNNLKIWVQLINSRTDEHIWANDYTREMKQIFSLQSEIAKEIASELETVISPEEIKMIDKKPTENLEAYNYFLKGNDYYWRGVELQDFKIAAKMYENSIALDPSFAKAYVRLSICYLSLYWFYYDHSKEILNKGKEAINRALEIDPNLPDAHIALANYYYWGFLNYTKALDEINIAEKQLINNSECIFTKGNIYRREGEWQMALENYLKAFELDPASAIIADNIGETCYLMGNYQESEKYYDKSRTLNPSFMDPYWEESSMYMKWKGNTVQSRKIISEAFQFKESGSTKEIFELSVLMDIYEGNYQKALDALSSSSFDVFDDQFYFIPKTLIFARIYRLMKMPEKAAKYFYLARDSVESEIRKYPDDPRLYSTIGLVYAGLGQKEKAISAGKKALDMMPVEKEAYRGVCRAEDLARIYVLVGNYDDALEQIKLLLSIPSELSVRLLFLDPDWKPLRNLVEFKKMTEL